MKARCNLTGSKLRNEIRQVKMEEDKDFLEAIRKVKSALKNVMVQSFANPGKLKTIW